jgi:hypothetical protein
MTSNSPEPNATFELTDRQKLIMALSDYLIIIVIIIDVLYWFNYIELRGGDIMALNVITVSIAFVTYNMKKRINRMSSLKKKKESEATSQESQR